MLNESDFRKAEEILGRYHRDAGALIPILQDLQAEFRHLPEELLGYMAGQLGISGEKARTVAAFYENFSFEARGKYLIRVCDGTACHVRNAAPVLEALWKELGLSGEKRTTDDGMFTVETVSCLDACSLAPTMMVNDRVCSAMTPEKALAVLRTLKHHG